MTDSIDNPGGHDILTPEEVALYLRKSPSWVYKHWQALGGRKFGGSLLFPRKEDLYERLFGKGKGMEIRLHPERDQAHQGLVQDKKRRSKGGKRTKRGDSKPGAATNTVRDDQDRHGLLGLGQ